MENKNEDVREVVMQCFVEIAREHYDILPPYMNKIADLTFKYAEDEEQKVAAQSIEFWTSITEEEMTRKLNNKPSQQFVEMAYDHLTQLLFKCVPRINENDTDEWGASLAAGCCLSALALLVKERLLGDRKSVV